MIALKQPKFPTWFANSVVLDASGNPELMFHSSDRVIQRFRSFTHFGTKEAATARSEAKGHDNPVLMAVFLSIRKPLEIFDDQADNNARRLLERAHHEGIFSTSERDAVNSTIGDKDDLWVNEPDEDMRRRMKWELGANVVSAAAAAKGFDGFRYNNSVEGGVSYIPFATSQIWLSDELEPHL